jgi:hypothetical protein
MPAQTKVESPLKFWDGPGLAVIEKVAGLDARFGRALRTCVRHPESRHSPPTGMGWLAPVDAFLVPCGCDRPAQSLGN